MKKRLSAILGITLIMICNNVWAQLSCLSYATAGSTYRQNFDGMPAGLTTSGTVLSTGTPAGSQGPFDLSVANGNTAAATNMVGWQVYKAAGSSSANPVILAINGGNSINGFVFAGINASTTNRALGFTKGNTLQKAAMGVVFVNNTGATLTSFHINYKAEQWRAGYNTSGSTSDVLSCKYAIVPSSVTSISGGSFTGIADADFITPVAYCLPANGGGAGTCVTNYVNGTLSANQVVKSLTVSGIAWNNGDKLIIRWEDLTGYINGGSPLQNSNQSGVAIDDFSFRAYNDDNPFVNNPRHPWMLFDSTEVNTLKIKMQQQPYLARYNTLPSGTGLRYALFGDTTDAKSVKTKCYYPLRNARSQMYPGNSMGFGSYQWGRRMQDWIIPLDQVINSPYFTQAEKDSLMWSCDSIAYRLRDLTYIKDGNEASVNNRTLDELMGVAFAGVFMFPENPNAQDHYNYVLEELESELKYVREDGSWPETSRYVGQVIVKCLSLFSRVERRFARNNSGLVSNPKFKGILDAFYKTATAPDDLNNGYREAPAIGDSEWGNSNLPWAYNNFDMLALGAAEIQLVDTVLSKRLYGMWKMAGSVYDRSGNNLSNSLVMIDESAPCDTSFILPSLIQKNIGNYIFRVDYGLPTEGYLFTHLPEVNYYHRHQDAGSFNLYSNRTPLMLDAGVGEYTDDDIPWFSSAEAHNIVSFKNSSGDNLPGLDRDAKILDTLLSTDYDYLKADITPRDNIARKYIRNIGYIKSLFNTTVVFDFLDTDSAHTNNLHTFSTSTDLFVTNGFKKSISHCYNNMDAEITYLLPAGNSILKNKGRVGIYKTTPGSWPRNLADTSDPADRDNCYQEWLTVSDTARSQYLTIIHPKKSTDSLTTPVAVTTSNPNCLAYKIALASGDYFIVLINRSDSTQSQTVNLTHATGLVNLRDNAGYAAADGQVQLTIPYATMFVLVPDSPAEPLNLMSFNGSMLKNAAELQWRITNGKKVQRFDVEGSPDAVNYSLKGIVVAGKATGDGSYNFTDYPDQKLKVNYYRLKMIDRDGKFTYSNVVALNNRGKSPIMIYPNPATAKFTIRYPEISQASYIEIRSIQGQKITTYSALKGSREASFDISRLASGQYIIIFKARNETWTEKLIKL